MGAEGRGDGASYHSLMTEACLVRCTLLMQQQDTQKRLQASAPSPAQ